MNDLLRIPLVGAVTGACLATIQRYRGSLDNGPVPIDGMFAAGGIVASGAAANSGHYALAGVLRGASRHALAVLGFRKTDQLTMMLLSAKTAIAGELSGDSVSGDGIGEDPVVAAARSL